MGKKNDNTRFFIKVPRAVIETLRDNPLGITPYLAIAVSYGSNKRATFTLDQFREFANKDSIGFTKSLLTEALIELQNQERISFTVDNKVFYVAVLDTFDDCESFAKIYMDEIYTLQQPEFKKQTCKLLYVLAYLRLNMNAKGLYYRTYTKLAKTLNLSNIYISRLCNTLQDLNIISIKQIDNGRQPDHTYKSNAKFEIFADKSNPDWQTNLKSLETQLASGIDDYDLW